MADVFARSAESVNIAEALRLVQRLRIQPVGVELPAQPGPVRAELEQVVVLGPGLDVDPALAARRAQRGVIGSVMDDHQVDWTSGPQGREGSRVQIVDHRLIRRSVNDADAAHGRPGAKRDEVVEPVAGAAFHALPLDHRTWLPGNGRRLP